MDKELEIFVNIYKKIGYYGVLRKELIMKIDNLMQENKELIIKFNDLKQENEYLNCIIQSDKDNYINKNLIKQKIKEYEYIVKDFELTDNSGRFKKERSIDYYKLEALKELLEE